MKPTGKQVWKWANKKIRASEAAGNGTECPTFREAGKRFGCSYDDLEYAISDPPDEADYFNLACAMGVGMGGGFNGYFEFDTRGEWLIEAY